MARVASLTVAIGVDEVDGGQGTLIEPDAGRPGYSEDTRRGLPRLDFVHCSTYIYNAIIPTQPRVNRLRQVGTTLLWRCLATLVQSPYTGATFRVTKVALTRRQHAKNTFGSQDS